MSVLAFPSSAAARNFQDLSHIFRDFRRPVPLFLARMEVVSRTAPRPVGLMRVAGLTPLVACLGRAGAPLTRLLQRVRLPARLFDRPEALIPTCQAARFIDEAASVEGFENVARLSNRNRQICGPGDLASRSGVRSDLPKASPESLLGGLLQNPISFAYTSSDRRPVSTLLSARRAANGRERARSLSGPQSVLPSRRPATDIP